jgi:L-ascorbate metabolism protein UlaG (beta-lactamase superfamily)
MYAVLVRRLFPLRHVGGLLLAWFLLATPCLLPAQDSQEATQPLTITFLVNEGFLIQADGKSILIDAFVKDEYYGYGALPESAYRQLVTGQAPFDNVTLALASHVHLDHFQVEPAVQFLQRNPDAAMISGEQVILAVRSEPSEPSVANQTIAVWPEPSKSKVVEHGGIKVEAFRLQHSGDSNNEVQNLGLLLQWGEHSVLHVGDAEGSERNFGPYELPQREIDVAILPVWHFGDRAMIDAQVGAKTYIAAHIVAKNLERTKRDLGESQPDVIVLEKPLEQWRAK